MNNKRYLTGIDWLMHTFDQMNKNNIGKGNAFHIVLEVKSLINIEYFERDLNQFINKCDIFKGNISRALNLAPYWRIDKNKEIKPITISSFKIKEASELMTCCTKIFEKPDHSNESYLYCKIIIHNEKSYVIFTFSHKVFDGIGAELFVNAFEKYRNNKNNYHIPDQYFEPSNLNGWTEKFQAGKQVNQKLIWLSPGRKVRALPIGKKKNYYQYKVIQYNKNETNKIIEKANKKAGYLLVMPFLLSQTVYAFDKLFKRKGVLNDSMVVPVTVNIRKKGEENEMFFNHLSFMFFKFTNKTVENPLIAIKNQLYEQIKSKFADKFCSNAMLMRILPTSILSKMLGLYSKGKIASFSFSYLGETVFNENKLSGEKVSNLFHLPCPSIPPGIGVFFNNYKGKLNLTISYLNTILNDEDIAYLVNMLVKMPNE